MDYTKLKKRPSYPFETIAVAIAFSPRIEGVLTEAHILAQKFGAQLLLIHIGERTREKEGLLDQLFSKIGINEKNVRITWAEGEPVETILELCKLNIVDLLILGALEKEGVIKRYLGSVARSISRRAKCSVLLLTEPKTSGSSFCKIMVNGVEHAKTIHTINTAVYFGRKIGAKEIIVATETHQPGLAMTIAGDSTATETSRIKKELADEDMSLAHAVVERIAGTTDITLTEKLIKGKPGFAIRQYAQTKKADLLVINSPDTRLGIFDRIFTHDMEYILEDLPCNVLIVHSRVTNE